MSPGWTPGAPDRRSFFVLQTPTFSQTPLRTNNSLQLTLQSIGSVDRVAATHQALNCESIESNDGFRRAGTHRNA